MNKSDPDRNSGEEARSPVDPAEDRLDSWKEIAAYTRRGIRTVQRWERDSALPVHRLNRDRRSVVFAFRSEINEWWAAQSNAAREDEISATPSHSAGAKSPVANSGTHRWFIAPPPLLWILTFLAAAGVWAHSEAIRTRWRNDSSKREMALPAEIANPNSRS